jgi:hypothetical protein
MKLRALCAVAVPAVLAVAVPAEAATVAPTAECVRFVPGVASLGVTASGFPAGASLTFKADGAVVGSGQADGAGNFSNAQSPFLPPIFSSLDRNLQTFQLTAEDGAGTVAGPVPLQLVRVVVELPSRARPARRVRYRVFGFVTGQRVYLHVRRRGRTLGRFSLGVASGPCGRTSKRMRFMPLERYRTGTYDYFFSHSRRFSRARALYGGRVTITRTVRSSAAAAVAQATAASCAGGSSG